MSIPWNQRKYDLARILANDFDLTTLLRFVDEIGLSRETLPEPTGIAKLDFCVLVLDLVRREKVIKDFVSILIENADYLSNDEAIEFVLTNEEAIYAIPEPEPKEEAEESAKQTIQEPEEEESGEFWNRELLGNHFLHLASVRANKSVLIVFIPGFQEHVTSAWGDFPEKLVSHLKEGCDVLACHYELNAEKSLAYVTKSITELIKKESSKYMHLFFVTRGMGSTIAKSILMDEVSEIERIIAANPQNLLPAIVGKTRGLYQIDPSSNNLHTSVFFDTKSFLQTKLAKIKGKAGAAQIKDEFASLNARVESEEANDKLFLFIDNKDLPVPSFISFKREYKDDSPNKIRLFASRNLSSALIIKEDKLVSKISDKVNYYFSMEMATAYLTYRRSYWLDSNVSLVSDEFTTDNASTDWSTTRNSQNVVFDKLKGIVNDSNQNRVILTGAAGVGKSFVIRRYARFRSKLFIQGDSSYDFCLFIAMQQISVDKAHLNDFLQDNSPEGGWKYLSKYLSHLFYEILTDANEERVFDQKYLGNDENHWEKTYQPDDDWFLDKIVDNKIVLVLDGVDEFLINNPAISIQSFNNLLKKVNSSSKIVLGVRNTLPAKEDLSLTDTHVLEILPLTVKNAEERFPGIEKIIENISKSNMGHLILTPLILYRLGPMLKSLDSKAINSRTSIFIAALKSIILQSNLPDEYSVNDWLQALSIISWVFYKENLGAVKLDKVQREVEDLKLRWSVLNHENSHCFEQGLSILENKELLSKLTSRTIFLSIGKNLVRFVHREWQDILVTDYLTHCVLAENQGDLSPRVFGKQIYIDSAEVLNSKLNELGVKLEVSWVDRVLKGANHVVLTNLVSTIGNGIVEITQPAFSALSKPILDETCAEGLRMVFLSAFGNRILRNHPDDRSAFLLRKLLIKLYYEAYKQHEISTHVISASMSWFYLKVLNQKVADMKGFELVANEDAGIKIAADSEVLWTDTDGEISVSASQRAFQFGAANYPLIVKSLPHEEISLTHYLYLVCAAVNSGSADPDILPLVRAIFSDSSGLRKRIDQFQFEELKAIFHSSYLACKEVMAI
jgi:2-hydroxy-3-keto-5-methylthiopentenyl-1-phosphate phosphatase